MPITLRALGRVERGVWSSLRPPPTTTTPRRPPPVLAPAAAVPPFCSPPGGGPASRHHIAVSGRSVAPGPPSPVGGRAARGALSQDGSSSSLLGPAISASSPPDAPHTLVLVGCPRPLFRFLFVCQSRRTHTKTETELSFQVCC